MCLWIEENLFEKIIYRPAGYDRETGGFIGIRDNTVLEYWFDEGIFNENVYSYVPNISELNKFLAMCECKEILKYGILHTHLNANITLSGGDILFIRKILNENKQMHEMFFPVVIPGKSLNMYSGKKTGNRIEVTQKEIFIINNSNIC